MEQKASLIRSWRNMTRVSWKRSTHCLVAYQVICISTKGEKFCCFIMSNTEKCIGAAAATLLMINNCASTYPLFYHVCRSFYTILINYIPLNYSALEVQAVQNQLQISVQHRLERDRSITTIWWTKVHFHHLCRSFLSTGRLL